MEKTLAKLQVGSEAHDLLVDPVTIGRAADNQIVLDDDSVSGHHAEVFIRDEQHFLRNLGSTNGTKVNGQPITETALNSGDVICFGSVEASFTAASPHLGALPLEDDTQPKATDGPIPDAEPPGPSVGSRLANLGKAAWQETKKNSHLLSLKAQIEKLTRMDLRQAFHDLGLKCYESKLCEDKFATHFQEIAGLEQRIEEKRKGVHAEEGANTMGKLRAVAEDQASKVAAEALTLKLSGLFVDVGKAAAAMENDETLLSKELAGVRTVEARIEELQGSYGKLARDHSSRDNIKSSSADLKGQALGMATSTGNVLKARLQSKWLIGTAAAAVIAVLIFFTLPKSSDTTAGASSSTSGTRQAVARPKSSDTTAGASRGVWNAVLEANHSQRNVTPFSSRFANLALRYSQIDLTNADTELVLHIQNSVDVFRDSRALCESLEAEAEHSKGEAETFVKVLSVVGMLFGAAVGDQNNALQNMQVGGLVGGELIGKGLAGLGLDSSGKELVAKYRVQIEKMLARGTKLDRESKVLAKTLSERYRTVFIDGH